MLWKCCTQYISRFGKLSSDHRMGESQLSFQSKRKAMPKNVQTTPQLHSSHTLAKYCSKFSRARFNSSWTVNLRMFKLDLEKAEEPEIKLPTSIGSLKNQEGSWKNINFCLIDCAKAIDCVDHNKLENSEIWEHQTIWSASWETHMHVRKQELEMDMVWNGERRTSRLYIVTLLIQLTCRVPHEKHRAGLNTSWNQDC